MESIIKQMLNGKVTCIVPCGEDLRMLKHILYQIKFTDGEPEPYLISNKEIQDFYGISEEKLCDKKEELMDNAIKSQISIHANKTKSFMYIKIFNYISYGDDGMEFSINKSIIPHLLGIRMGAEMFQGIK